MQCACGWDIPTADEDGHRRQHRWWEQVKDFRLEQTLNPPDFSRAHQGQGDCPCGATHTFDEALRLTSKELGWPEGIWQS